MRRSCSDFSDVRPIYAEEGVRVGRMGEITPVSARTLAKKCAKIFGDERAAVAGDEYKQVKTVAIVCGGGGSIDLLELAAKQGADCYITGDVPHHVALYARECGTPIVVLSHYRAERIYMKRLGELLSDPRGARAHGRGDRSEAKRSAIPVRTEEL